jgi:hypothetical protein
MSSCLTELPGFRDIELSGGIVRKKCRQWAAGGEQ